jgi:hypothetical protein
MRKSNKASATTSDSVELFPNFTVSVAEKAVLVRLLRVMRMKRYWLSYCIQWLLRADAEITGDISIEEAENILREMKNFRNWENYLASLKQKIPAIANHPAVAWTKLDLDDVDEYQDQAEIRKLVDSATRSDPESLCLLE